MGSVEFDGSCLLSHPNTISANTRHYKSFPKKARGNLRLETDSIL